LANQGNRTETVRMRRDGKLILYGCGDRCAASMSPS
jgi:hypothetical protein